MYLCLWGGRPRIVECQMDGKECSTLYEVPRGSPNYIAVNSRELAVVGDSSRESHVMKYLYWTDSKLDSIEFLTLEHEMHGRTQLLNFRFVATIRSKKFSTKQKKPWTTCINIKKNQFLRNRNSVLIDSRIRFLDLNNSIDTSVRITFST